MKILIVEDNQYRIAMFKTILGKTDYDIVTSSKEAIERLKINNYDYIFLDHDLGIDPKTGEKTENVMLDSGDGTGYEVAKYIAEKDIDDRAKIVLHTFNFIGAGRMKSVLSNAICLSFGTSEFVELLDYLGDKTYLKYEGT